MRGRTIGIVLLFLPTVLWPAMADDPRPAAAALTDEEQELVAMERLRLGIEDVFESYRTLDPAIKSDTEELWRHVDRLLAFGEEAVPLWEQELDGGEMRSYYLAAFAVAFLDSDLAVPLLRRALDRIPAGGAYTRAQRKLACFGLALQGDAEVLGFMLEGNAEIAADTILEGWNTLELSSAVLGAPGRDKLIALLKRYDTEDLQDRVRLSPVLSALAKVPGPEASAAARPFLEDPGPVLRYVAIQVIGNERAPSTARFMIDFLRTRRDEDPRTRNMAARFVAELAGNDDLEPILTLLETETSTNVRGSLYRAIALRAGARGLPALRSHWGRADRDDRIHLVDAVGLTGSNEALNILRQALTDPDALVAIHAVDAFRDIGTAAAMDSLLAAIRDPRKSVSSTAIRASIVLQDRRAAPRVANILLKEELTVRDELTTVRDRVRLLGDALVFLEYTEPIVELRRLATGQSDVEIRAALNTTADRLERIATHGTDASAWLGELGATDPGDRALAYRQLARIANKKAVEGLAAAFEAASLEERETLLVEVTRYGDAAFLPLYEAILDDPDLDFDHFHEVRAWAAWGAGRVGTERAVEALTRSVVRRDGRDFHVVAYLLGLDVPDVADFVDGFRVPRLRRPAFQGGLEQDELDSMVGVKRIGRDDPRTRMAPDAFLGH